MKQLATITVIGRDKTGVIASVTHFLFEQHANIEALEEQVTRGQFSMTLQASWKTSAYNGVRLRAGLAELARKLGMEITVHESKPHTRQRMAIMVTREPHCFEALADSVKRQQIKAEIGCVIANRPDLKGAVEKRGLPFHLIPWNERDEAENQALALLQEYQIDFVVLARFMKILSPNFVWRHKNKIINIHPSLLPSFPGPQAYRQAYEHGVKIIGVTAHFVSMHLDEGPIIAQESFRVRTGLSLKEIMAAGQRLESKALLKAVRLFLSKRLDVYWGQVKLV